jgi:nicotinamidase/pyrazinamidase
MKVLIVVDPQNDFMPGGNLAVTDGDMIVPVINKLTKSGKFDYIIFTKDWHPSKMKAFASQYNDKNVFDKYTNPQGLIDVLWPDHCIEDTEGAMFHKDINMDIPNLFIFKKGTSVDNHPYSGFGDLKTNDSSGLLEFLEEKKATDVYIVGLATDYCVKDTALDSAKEGFNTFVIMDGVRAISDDIIPTLNDFEKNDVLTITSEVFVND